MSTVERLAEVCWSYGHDGGVAHDDGDPVERRAQLVAGDLGEDRAGALAHVRGAGVDDDAAVGEQAHGRVGEPGRRARLDARRRCPGRDRAAAASPQPMSSAARRTACSQSPSAGVSPGMNASPLRARLRSRISSRSMPERARPLVEVRLDRPVHLRIAEAAEGRGRAWCARGSRGPRSARAGHAVRPAAGVAALADDPVGDVGVGADQVVGRDVLEGERAVGPEARPDADLAAAPGAPPGTSPRGVRTRRTGRPARRAMKRDERLELRRAACRRSRRPGRARGRGPWRAAGRGRRPAILCSQLGMLDRAPDRDAVPSGAAMKACGSMAKWVTIGNV